MIGTEYYSNSAGSVYKIEVIGAEEVAKRLGELGDKTPAAIKVAVNATAREARKVMIAKAKARYAVNAAGARHLKDLKPTQKATNTRPFAEIKIKSARNDLGYFDYHPKGIYTGADVFRYAPPNVRARVLKSSARKPLTGTASLSKGFVLQFSSGHIGMVQRDTSKPSKNTTTRNGYKRWVNKKTGKVDTLKTMGSPSATAMHNTIWDEARPEIEAFLVERLDAQIEKVIERAARKAM